MQEFFIEKPENMLMYILSLDYPNPTKEDFITEYGNEYKWLTHPRNRTFLLQTRYMNEMQVLSPAQPEKFVEAAFGAKALAKFDRKCFSGRWMRNN